MVELLELDAQAQVLDLFCGLGNFTLPLARRAAHVVGVEGEAALVARARDNAALNGIGNAEFFSANLAGRGSGRRAVGAAPLHPCAARSAARRAPARFCRCWPRRT